MTTMTQRLGAWPIPRLRDLRQRRDVPVIIGCSPFGRDGWLNVDLFPASGIRIEHHGGSDAGYLQRTLEQAGFGDTREVAWGEGRFPGGAIDRDQHRPSSLYMEAIRRCVC